VGPIPQSNVEPEPREDGVGLDDISSEPLASAIDPDDRVLRPPGLAISIDDIQVSSVGALAVRIFFEVFGIAGSGFGAAAHLIAQVAVHQQREVYAFTRPDDAVKQASPSVQAVIEGLQALRGVAKVSATTIAVEIGSFSRFETAKQLMAYCGVVPSEHSSGNTRRQGAITKTGNAHVRRVLFESAWSCRHRPNLSVKLKERQRRASAATNEIALKAQHRLHRRYLALAARGKPSAKIVGAVGRELLGFIWAVAVQIEQEHASKPKQKVAA